MTTIGYEGLDAVLGGLEQVRGRHRLVQAAQAAAAMLTVVLAGLVVLGLACGYWPDQPPRVLRWGLLAATVVAWIGAALRFVVLPLRRRLNYAQAARLAESALGGLDNGLINAVQLADDPAQSPPLVQMAIDETRRRTAGLALPSAVQLRALRSWSIAAAVAAAGVALFALFQGPRLARGLSAVFNPTAYVRSVGSVRLLSLTPGDTTMFAGEMLNIVAKIDNGHGRRYDAVVELAGGKGPRAMLAAPDRATYACGLGKVEQSLQYAVGIGDSRFPDDRPWYTVTVLARVQVEGLDLVYTYSAYTRLAERPVVNAAGPIECPAGTAVKLTLRLSSPVPAVLLERRSGEKLALRPDEGGKSFAGVLRVMSDDAYRIVLTDSAGRRLQQLPDLAAEQSAEDYADGMYPIKVIADAPPKVAFVEPRDDCWAAPAGKLAVRVKATDDFGLAWVRLFAGRQNEPPKQVCDFEKVAGAAAADREHALTIGPEYRAGDTLILYAAAADERMAPLGGPQTTETARLKVRIEDPAKLAAAKADRFEKLRARLLALLAAQEKQRVNTDIAWKKLADLPAVRATGKQIADGQQAMKLDVFDVVDHFGFDPEMETIKSALAELGSNDAALAASQAAVVAALPELARRDETCGALAGTQDKIIQSLQWMLAIMPALAKPEVAKKTAEGADLPPEVKDKLLALKNELDKFTQEERKVIQAAERLAKKPVDTFTKEDDQLLKDLQAIQDKWEKFLNEQFADFSKLAQQDFSKPSMLQELLSVKTDVTMAKDALSKQATEIATAIEDNGIENAQTLTANIEKWLPDEPDRVKWDMEDPAGQSNIEQAELPKELEDLVGDLLEQEEDVFEEMEDVTGKYAMSGDKGIGWDAMDGPISNMNAQGVTGNQLPNTSEISGRSGEGRQGKATGEFIEDKAVGKGGRRTPTRLTPEPFQQGQINDTSQEPAGGSTGGGKLSGSGGEGLEGPLPPPLQRAMKALAGKHAQLLNKAERVEAGMKVSDYSNYQFLQAVMLMNRVQNDLENYRYTNVLRSKQVTLGVLKQTQKLLSGEIDVTADTTGQLPKHVRDDIADAMKAKLPPEFQDALRRYFTRLAESGSTAVPPVAPGSTAVPPAPSTQPAGKK